MSGLNRICRLYGALKVTGGGKTVHYVWDYVADEAVEQWQMPLGSERWRESEKKRMKLARAEAE